MGGAGPRLGPRALWLLWFVKATWVFLKVTTVPRPEGVAILLAAVSAPGTEAVPCVPGSSWGVCFTYGTWFGLEAFACMGQTYRDG